MNKLLVTLVILSLLVLNVHVDAKKKNKHDGGVEPQEPHYKNGEHNAKGHHQGKWKREDDDDDDEDEKESEDNEEIDEELKECPVFKKSHGCPFAHTHDAGVDYDPAKIKGCPAFGEGCPYAQGNEDLLEKVKGCPAFKGGHCPFTDKEVDMDKIKECPAFKSGCPYDTAHSPHHALHHAHHHGHHGGHHHGYFHALSGKKGCPYSGMEINQISNCPAFKNGCPFDSNGRIDMEKIKECPIFKEGCPFDFSQETELTSLCPFFQTNARKTKAQEFVNLYFGIGFEEASFDALLAEHFTYLAVTDVIPQNRGTALTLETLKTTMSTVRKNFASTITFEDVVAEGNTVVVHATVEATSAEAIDGLSGISPSKTGSTRGVWIVHFTSDEKIGSVTTLLDIESFRSHYQQ